MPRPMNQVVAARYIGSNYDLSEVDPSNPESYHNALELIIAMDVLNVDERNQHHFARNAVAAYNAQG